MKRIVLSILILLSFIASTPKPGIAMPGEPQAPHAPSAPNDTPVTLVNDPHAEFALHAGVLYWDVYCYIVPLTGQELDAIKRQPAGGGAISTVVSGDGCDRFQNLAADDSGVYYVDRVLNKIRRVPADIPNAAPQDVTSAFNVSFIKLDGDYVYFNLYDNKILRAPKTGGAAVTFIQSDFYLSDAIFDAYSVYWLDNSGLWWAPKNCASLPCARQSLSSAARGRNMRFGSIGGNAASPASIIYAHHTQSGSNFTQSIRELSCSAGGGCALTTHYTAGTNWQIGRFSYISLPRSGSPPVIDFYLFWTEVYATSNTGRLMRKLVNSATPATEIYTGNAGLNADIFTQTDSAQPGVYFAQSPLIMFLPFTAGSITRDLSAFNVEVTQGIQNSANQAPLVADKKTFARAYARQSSGPAAGGVEATLTGTRNGIPLPGSPLLPTNGALALAVGKNYDRQNVNDGWLFELPASWYAEGSIILRLNVDPRGLYADTNLANNTSSTGANFVKQPDACLFFSPVRTNNPMPGIDKGNFWETLDRFNRVWPSSGVDAYWMGEPIEELETCSWHGLPYPCFGPYEMNQESDFPSNWPSDKDRVIGKLILRQIVARALSFSPVYYCEHSASVHSVGLVHPDADTTDARGTTMGYANLFFNASWYKMEPYNATPSAPNWYWPRAASVLAQEVTHNFNRGHINCGNPENPDTGWPYLNPCQLNDGGQTAYYGFDVKSRQPIPPEVASDFMSYSPATGQNPLWQGKWVSDYTYRYLNNLLLNNAAPTRVTSPNWAKDTNMVMATGAVHVARNLGSIDYAYIQPVAGMSAQARQVWAEFAAPAHVPSAQPANTQTTYHLRLKNAAGDILDDRVLNLLAPDPHEEDAAHRYVASFAAPAGTATQMELLADATVLATQNFGPATPAISLVTPAAGSLINDSLTVSWQASDADTGDQLRFNIEYSPDGANWIMLAEERPALPGQTTQTFTLKNPLALPGSAGATARVRVTASDGYHTASATSGAFSVAQRAPLARITTPRANESFEAGVSVPLRGTGFDAESGVLADTALAWAVDGVLAGSGADTSIDGLAPGAHTVVLTATDSTARAGTTQNTLKIDPLATPLQTASPSLDGACDDAGYVSASHVRLAPYTSGGQASAALLRTSSDVWVCLSGLARGSDSLIGRAGVFVDANDSRDPLAQPGDIMLMVGEDGAKISGVGTGAGGYTSPAPAAYAAHVKASGSAWSAELRIPLGAIGGADHSVGMMFAHTQAALGSDSFAWPYAGQPGKPKTWAQTALGALPRLTQMSPDTATAGGAGFTIILSGTNFTNSTGVLWNGVNLPATFISATRVTAIVSAAQIGAAGVVNVQTRNSAIPDATTSALPFTINNPVPLITALLPSAAAQDTAVSLVAQGSQFINGAVVLWDGIPLATTYVSSGQLLANVPAALLDGGRTVQVSVQNPEPAGGASNAAPFSVTSVAGAYRALLPMLWR